MKKSIEDVNSKNYESEVSKKHREEMAKNLKHNSKDFDIGTRSEAFKGKSKKRKMTIISLLTISAATSIIAGIVKSSAEGVYAASEAVETFNPCDDFMIHTSNGNVVTLPINENPISIVIENLNDKDRDSVIRAIDSMDKVSSNLSYTILDTDDVKIKNKIYISDSDLKEDQLGITTLKYNKNTGTIKYPIYIKLDTDFCHEFSSKKTGDDAVCAVTKHELGHTLGFADLYNSNYTDESIMWHNINLENYTYSDEERIRAVYGGYDEDESGNIFSSTDNGMIEKDTIDDFKNSVGVLNQVKKDIFKGYETNVFAQTSPIYDTKTSTVIDPNKTWVLSHSDSLASVYEPAYISVLESDFDFKKYINKFKTPNSTGNYEEERQF